MPRRYSKKEVKEIVEISIEYNELLRTDAVGSEELAGIMLPKMKKHAAYFRKDIELLSPRIKSG